MSGSRRYGDWDPLSSLLLLLQENHGRSVGCGLLLLLLLHDECCCCCGLLLLLLHGVLVPSPQVLLLLLVHFP